MGRGGARLEPALRIRPWFGWASALVAGIGVGVAVAFVLVSYARRTSESADEVLQAARLVFTGALSIAGTWIGVWVLRSRVRTSRTPETREPRTSPNSDGADGSLHVGNSILDDPTPAHSGAEARAAVGAAPGEVVTIRLLGSVGADGIRLRSAGVEALAALSLLSWERVDRPTDEAVPVDMVRLAQYLDTTVKSTRQRLQRHRDALLSIGGGLEVDGDTAWVSRDRLDCDAGRLRTAWARTGSESDRGDGWRAVLLSELTTVSALPFTDAVRPDGTSWPWLDDYGWPHTVAAWVREAALRAADLYADDGDTSAAATCCRAGLRACPEDVDLASRLRLLTAERLGVRP